MRPQAAAAATCARSARRIVAVARESGDAEMMRTGEVAARVGLSLRTVRYYEEMGLIEPEMRTEGGFRLYSLARALRRESRRRGKPAVAG